MILRYPAYFEKFSCVAARCPDSCCKQWEVQVDEETAGRYFSLQGALGDDLRRSLRREEGQWYLTVTHGRCPMWRADGLCRVQTELGHDALCQTCREFPRLTHDYGDFVERGLELSCPEAARIIFENRDTHWIQRECLGGDAPDYDPEDMKLLLRTREKMLELLSDRRRPVPETLALALLYGYHVQSLLDGAEDRWEPRRALSMGKRLARPSDPARLAAFYADLEILTEDWRRRLQSTAGTAWDDRLLILARYGVERYWLQAISDLDLAGRVKMVILSCLLVRSLGGDFVQTAQLYSKEIENNAENVEAILDGAYSSPALTDDVILGFLLSGEEIG